MMPYVTLRENILELLGEEPQTASTLARTIGVDKSSVKQVLVVLERRGLVACQQRHHGKVIYKFWRLRVMGASSDPPELKNRRG
jgi:DNA-binding IclR family transcriptional regulator